MKITIVQAETRAKLGDSKGSAQAYESALAAKPAGNIELLQGLVTALVADGKPQQVCWILCMLAGPVFRAAASCRQICRLVSLVTWHGRPAGQLS